MRLIMIKNVFTTVYHVVSDGVNHLVSDVFNIAFTFTPSSPPTLTQKHDNSPSFTYLVPTFTWSESFFICTDSAFL